MSIEASELLSDAVKALDCLPNPKGGEPGTSQIATSESSETPYWHYYLIAERMMLQSNLSHPGILLSYLRNHNPYVRAATATALSVSGTAEDVLLRPKHPYTQKLIASIPQLHGAAEPEFLSGAPPDLVEPPTGCRFHPRCPKAFEPCAKEAPPAFEAEAGHTVRCWLYGDPVS